MSKHNYTQYSKKNENESVVTQNTVTIEPDVTVTEETTNTAEVKMEVDNVTPEVNDPVPEPDETVPGTVFNCAKLNVRAIPALTGDVVCTVDVGSEFIIDLAKSYNEWYHVTTATGIDGYCMRKYVNVSL